ncbi:MAG: hypothetical protein AB7F79_08500 [Steroidobacteraceae bacterium]
MIFGKINGHMAHFSCRTKRYQLVTLVAVAISSIALALFAPDARASQESCDRDCLTAFAENYWDALISHDRKSLLVHSDVKFTENNVPLKLGQALWRTISGAGPHDIVFADPVQGTVALTAVVEELGNKVLFLARLKIERGKISEIETFVPRLGNSHWMVPGGWYWASDFLREDVPSQKRTSREDMVKIADAYFDRLIDQSLPTPPLDDRCNRIENGIRTTNNPDPTPGIVPPPVNPAVTSLTCAQQFARKGLNYLQRVRDRRYVMVDEVKGIVLANVVFDHDGDEFTPVKDTHDKQPSLMPPSLASPNTTVVSEFFKIEDGKITHLQAALVNVPFGMASTW